MKINVFSIAVSLAYALALIALISIGQWAFAGEQVAYGAQTTHGAPWYVMLALVIWPAVFAIILTIGSMIMVRRINRSAGKDPLKVWPAVKFTLAFGAVWGPLIQWGLQDQTSMLTGLPVQWKLVVIAPFITGIGAMIAYDMLRAYTKGKYPKFYALLSCKHEDDVDYTDSHINGDLTRMMEEDETRQMTDAEKAEITRQK